MNKRGQRGALDVILIAGCDSSEPWVGGSVTNDSFRHRRGNPNDPVRLGSTGSLNITAYDWNVGRNFSFGKWYEIDVFVLDASKLDGIAVYLSKDGGTTNIATKNFTSLYDGWQTLRWHEDEFIAGGNWTNADFRSVQAAILGVDSAAGQTTEVIFQNFYNVQRKAHFGIGVDDGTRTVVDEMKAIISDEYGYRFSFYIFTSEIDVNPNFETWVNLKSFQDEGNILGVHNHAVGNFVTSSSTEAQIRADWDAAINLFVTNNIVAGPAGKYHYAASNGAITGPAELLQRDYFLTSRRNSFPASFGPYDLPVNPNDLFGYIYRPSVSTDTYLGYIDDVVEQQRGMELVPHYMLSLDPTNSTDLGITPQDLRTILDHVRTYERRDLLQWVDRDDYLTDYTFN